MDCFCRSTLTETGSTPTQTKEKTAQTTSNLIASLLKELVEDNTAAYNNVKSLYECRLVAVKQNPSNFRMRFGRHCSRKARGTPESRVFIVVDALDKTSEVDGTRGKLLTVLKSFLGWSPMDYS